MSITTLPRVDGSDFTHRVAANVRGLKGRLGVNQATLAVVLGVSQSQVSKRLRGTLPLDTREIGLLADYFGVDPGELTGAGPGNPHTPGTPARRSNSGWSRNGHRRLALVGSWEHTTGLIPTAA